MTPDRQARALWWPVGLAVLVVLVFVAVLCAAMVDDACHHTPPPVDVPEPGTDRAAYCDALAASHPWLLLIAAPTLLAALALVALRRAPLWAVGGALAVAGLACVNVSVAMNLAFRYTI